MLSAYLVKSHMVGQGGAENHRAKITGGTSHGHCKFQSNVLQLPLGVAKTCSVLMLAIVSFVA